VLFAIIKDMDFNKRDQIIFSEEYKPEKYAPYGIRYFKELSRFKLNLLLELGLFSVYPWLRYAEYWWFMEEYGRDNQLFFHGFTYSEERSDGDYGIVIEGFGRYSPFENKEAEKVFTFLFKDADQFDLNPPWVWYD
jgi:hypothetical protein